MRRRAARPRERHDRSKLCEERSLLPRRVSGKNHVGGPRRSTSRVRERDGAHDEVLVRYVRCEQARGRRGRGLQFKSGFAVPEPGRIGREGGAHRRQREVCFMARISLRVSDKGSASVRGQARRRLARSAITDLPGISHFTTKHCECSATASGCGTLTLSETQRRKRPKSCEPIVLRCSETRFSVRRSHHEES